MSSTDQIPSVAVNFNDTEFSCAFKFYMHVMIEQKLKLQVLELIGFRQPPISYKEQLLRHCVMYIGYL